MRRSAGPVSWIVRNASDGLPASSRRFSRSAFFSRATARLALRPNAPRNSKLRRSPPTRSCAPSSSRSFAGRARYRSTSTRRSSASYLQNYLPSRPEERLEGRQAHPRHRAVRGDLPARQLERELLRHACAGARLVLARHVRLAQGQPPGAWREGRAATPLPDGAMIIKEMYTPARRRLRQHPVGSAASDRARRGGDDPRQPGVAGWLVLGLGRVDSDWQPDWPNRAATNAYPCSGFGQYCTNCHSSAANNQTFSVAQEHRRRTRRAAGLSDADDSSSTPRGRASTPASPSRPWTRRRYRDGKVNAGLCPHLSGTSSGD